MGRHRTAQEKDELGLRARGLREQGWSRARIATELHVGGVVLSELLAGSEVPAGLRRPRARDDARALARQLRRAGWTYDQIARELGVAKSSCSLWLRDLPRPGSPPDEAVAPHVPRSPEEGEGLAPSHPPAEAAGTDVVAARLAARQRRRQGALLGEIAGELAVSLTTVQRWCAGLPLPPRARHGRDPDDVRAMGRARWDTLLAEREQERAAVKAAERSRVGDLSPRELELLAVTLYWAEGGKDKAYARRERVTFTNSDADTVRLWLSYLDLVGVPEEHRRFRLSIHESADLDAAHAEWSEVVGLSADNFQPPTLKRHQPLTNRKNVGEAYKGCLVVRCTQSRTLYQRIEGTWQGIMAGVAGLAV